MDELFDLNKYLIPIWEGDTVYDESVMVIEDKDGFIPLQSLAYEALSILSVKNAELTKSYNEGVDYALKDGKLEILNNSSIYHMSYDEYYPKEDLAGKCFGTDNGFTTWQEEGFLHKRQISVTYTHKPNDIYQPIRKNRKTDILSRLNNKENLKFLFYGDSITFGWNCSKLADLSPNLPSWGELTVKGLSAKFGYNDTSIEYINTSVSGTSVNWGLENVKQRVCEYNPDMVFIAFGMNNPKTDPDIFKDTLEKMITKIRNTSPLCNIGLVATTLPNPEIVSTRGHRHLYLPLLWQIAENFDNIVVCDMTTLHTKLLAKKPYFHMTGNNVNHPNDFLMRQYVAMALDALIH